MPSPTWSERPPTSWRQNLSLAGLAASLLCGGALAQWAPRTLWRDGSPTALGDFSLLVAVTILAWGLLASPSGRGRWMLAGAVVLVPLLLREVLWRKAAAGFALACLYGTGFAIAVLLPLGRNVLELLWARHSGRPLRLGDPPLDLGGWIGWLLVLDLIFWMFWALRSLLVP